MFLKLIVLYKSLNNIVKQKLKINNNIVFNVNKVIILILKVNVKRLRLIIVRNKKIPNVLNVRLVIIGVMVNVYIQNCKHF